MKIKISILLFTFCLFFFTSCKKNKNEQKEIDVEIESNLNKSKLLDRYALQVEMNFKTDSKGLYQIKFRDRNSESKPIISYLKVEDTNKDQVILGEYDLENHDIPSYVQIILSENENQNINFNYIKLTTDEVHLVIDKKNFNDFITTSSFVNYDDLTGLLTTKKIDDRFIPVISLNKKALDSLYFF